MFYIHFPMTGPTIPGPSTATSSLPTPSPPPLSCHSHLLQPYCNPRHVQIRPGWPEHSQWYAILPNQCATPWIWLNEVENLPNRAQKSWGRGRSMKRGVGKVYKVWLPFFLSFFTTQLTLSYPINRTLPNTNTCPNGCVFGTHHPFGLCYDMTGVFSTSPRIKMWDGGFAHPPLPLWLTFQCNNIRKKIEW